MGLAGTSGNGLWIHDSSFHHNATGLAFDSLYPGHPGMPQDCSKIKLNHIYSNNMDNFTAKRDKYCLKAPLKSVTRASFVRRSQRRSEPGSCLRAATATSTARTGFTTTGAGACSSSGCRPISGTPPRRRLRHVERQHLRGEITWASGRAARRRRTVSTSGRTRKERETAGAATSPAAAGRSEATRRFCRAVLRTRPSTRPTRPRFHCWSRARRGTRGRIPIHPAASGWGGRPARTSQEGLAERCPAASGRAARRHRPCFKPSSA